MCVVWGERGGRGIVWLKSPYPILNLQSFADTLPLDQMLNTAWPGHPDIEKIFPHGTLTPS